MTSDKLGKILISDYGTPCGECGKQLNAKECAYLVIDNDKSMGTIICIECAEKHLDND